MLKSITVERVLACLLNMSLLIVEALITGQTTLLSRQGLKEPYGARETGPREHTLARVTAAGAEQGF